jgi:Trk K+ transport system NAD-binding subunit
MSATFRNHAVICGWNHRGLAVVDSLKSFGNRPILVINTDIQTVIKDVGSRDGVFAVAGDPVDLKVLIGADVESARSVIVLADYGLGQSADARSVQIALAVEKIQVSVHTVVELVDVRNKNHFRWTKVDELVSDEELSAKMIAQGIRHVLSEKETTDASELASEVVLLDIYRQLVQPHHNHAQLFRVNSPWEQAKNVTFDEILSAGLGINVLPLALAGYKMHEIAARPGQEAWTSWKIEVKTNPTAGKPLELFWPNWPEGDYPLGILVLAKSRQQAELLDGFVAKCRA